VRNAVLSTFNDLEFHERYRRAAFALAAVLCGFVSVSHFTGYTDPILVFSRIMALTIMLGAGIALTVSRTVRDHCGWAGIAMSLALLAHQIVAISLRGLTNDLTLNLLLSLIVISIVLHTRMLLALSLTIWCQGIIGTTTIAASSEFNHYYFNLVLCAASLFLYLIIGGMIRANGPASPAEVQAAHRDTRHWQGTVDLRIETGAVVWVDLSLLRTQIVDDDFLLVRFNDVTARKENETALRRADLQGALFRAQENLGWSEYQPPGAA
jgi:hypothetical protein